MTNTPISDENIFDAYTVLHQAAKERGYGDFVGEHLFRALGIILGARFLDKKRGIQ